MLRDVLLAVVTAAHFSRRFGTSSPCSAHASVQGLRVVSEDKIAVLGRLVAGEARFVQRLIARFAILQVGESPAARRGVLF